MAIRTPAELRAAINRDLPDNDAEKITPEKLRQILIDMTDTLGRMQDRIDALESA